MFSVKFNHYRAILSHLVLSSLRLLTTLLYDCEVLLVLMPSTGHLCALELHGRFGLMICMPMATLLDYVEMVIRTKKTTILPVLILLGTESGRMERMRKSGKHYLIPTGILANWGRNSKQLTQQLNQCALQHQIL